jgi:hypothetical protein
MSTDGEAAANPAIKVLISYAHEDERPQVAVAVKALCDQLRDPHGVEAIIDQHCMPSGPSEGWPRWMDAALERANFIVCVITEAWVRRVTGNEVEGRGNGVAWEGEYIYNLLYSARGDTCRVVLVRLPGDTCPPPVRLGRRHLHQLPQGLDTLVGTLRGERIDPVDVVYDQARSDAARRAAAGHRPTGGAAGTPSPVEAIDARSAFAEAVELLEAALADDKLAAVVRRALRDPPEGLAAHLRDMTASEVVDALNQLHAELTKAGVPAEARHVERAVLLLLPFLGDWARLLTVARRATGLQVDLPLVDLTLAEVLLAGADGRPCHFKLRGDGLEPAQLVMLTAARRAYRDRPETLAKLIEQSMERRASGSVYDGVAELLGESAFVEDLYQLAHAVRGDAHPSQGVPVAADPAALRRLDQKMYADRSTKVAEDRRCWSLVIADERSAADGPLWTLVCTALGPLRGLRLVRLSGDHDIDDFDLGVSLEHLSKMKLRSSP